jgi:hypothetical protein
MSPRILLPLTIAALAFAGCEKSATVTGDASEKLTLKEPSAVTIERGGMAKADVDITRHGVTGEVSVAFSNLPKGVDVVDPGNKIVGDHATYTLRASDSADLVEKSVGRVTASAAGGIAVSQPINVTVKEKKQ